MITLPKVDTFTSWPSDNAKVYKPFDVTLFLTRREITSKKVHIKGYANFPSFSPDLWQSIHAQ